MFNSGLQILSICGNTVAQVEKWGVIELQLQLFSILYHKIFIAEVKKIS